MKITTTKKLDSYLLGRRVLKEYSYTDTASGSNDGMRGGYTYTVHAKNLGKMENETRNPDGTYTYDYSSIVSKGVYNDIERSPEYSLKEMIQELLVEYNIHEFSTDIQEEPNNIKDYYAIIKATSTYQKESEPSISYSWSIGSKDSKGYIEEDNSYTVVNIGGFGSSDFIPEQKIKSESVEDVNKKLNGSFSKEDYILYLMGSKVIKAYKIRFGLDDIGEDETIEDFLKKIQLETPKYQTFESALKENAISMEDIKNLILKHKNLSAKEMPVDVLEQLFNEDQELISHFNEREMPISILRKYCPNFDITKVNPSDLIPSDLDSVLKKVVQNFFMFSLFNTQSEKKLKQDYLEYLQSFYDNPNALRKIIKAMNTTNNTFFRSNANDFISQISPEVMTTTEIRDTLLDTENISLSQLVKYELDYDTDSARKLMGIISNSTSKTPLKDINSVLSILQQNGINSDEILQTLRENGFNIYLSDSKEGQEQILMFKSFGINGIGLDDIRDNLLKEKDFNYLKLADDISPEDMTREYNSLLNELAEKNGKKDGKDTKRYEEIFDLMGNYSNASELFSRLTPEVKELTKKLMINNLDVIETLQKGSVVYSSEFSKLMETMSKSFEMTEEDMTNIYIKCLNNGASKDETISMLQQYIPKEERIEFAEKINSANIYPNPKYFWLTDRNIRRIRVNRGENRGTIKSKIQADGRCFSTRVKTDMVGESNEGKKIAVNNLSKWLFGVPGARGNLTITRAGDYIQLPGNTPDEAVELIETVLLEKSREEHSK